MTREEHIMMAQRYTKQADTWFDMGAVVMAERDLRAALTHLEAASKLLGGASYVESPRVTR